MGRLIPAGTGFEFYRNVRIPADEPPPPPPPSQEELDLEREMEYLVEADETFGHVRTVSLDDLAAWGHASGLRWDVTEHHGGWLVLDRR